MPIKYKYFIVTHLLVGNFIIYLNCICKINDSPEGVG